MTCGYMQDVATADTWAFFKLLFRWNGSVWKAIHMEIIVWLFIFVNIRTVYEFFIRGTDAAYTYEHIVARCREISGKSRTFMTFAIGFFVTYVSNRWWSIFMTIPWPDTCALQLTAYLRTRGGKYEQEDTVLRQNIMRYLWLSYVLVFRDVSVRIKKRFPTIKSLTPTLLTEEELSKLNKSSKEMRPWVPIEWALEFMKVARNKLLIDEFHQVEVNQTILTYRQQLHEILSFDSITVPLVYVQSVHICSICYFLLICFSSQTISGDYKSWQGVIDIYLPIYGIIEFIVFVGWLKTAFVMLNPFGMDDDDFEMNSMIERNLMVSLSYINDFYDKPPKLIDMKVSLPTNLQTAVRENTNPMHGSAVPVKVKKVHQAMLRNPQIVDLVSNVLTNQAAATDRHTYRPIDEMVKLPDKLLIDEKSRKSYRNPHNSDNSSRDDGENNKKFYLKEKELEEAVAKLVKKRLNEEKELLLLEATQKSSPEDQTQVSEMGELAKATSNTSNQKIIPKALPSKQEVRAGSAVSQTPQSVADSTRKVVPKKSVSKTVSLKLLSPHISPSESESDRAKKKQESSLKCDDTQSD